MNLWFAYPGQLAHFEEGTRPLVEGGTRVGTAIRASCGRQLRVFWERPVSAEACTWPMTPYRVDGSRRVCLRCWYWALVAALVIAPQGNGYRPTFREFVDATGRGWSPEMPEVAVP